MSEDIHQNAIDIANILTAPIGTIIAWTPLGKGNVIQNVVSIYILLETTSLPDGWMLCDGAEIVEGIWKGRKTPDLNKSKRFLRGGALEDILKTEESTIDLPSLSVNDRFLYPGGTCPGGSSYDGSQFSMNGVKNYASNPRSMMWPSANYGCNGDNICHDNQTFTQCYKTSSVTDGLNGEIKPDNMNVLFIIRIK